MWKQCHHCGFHFDIHDQANEHHGVIWFKGQIEGHICPTCKG